jgi:hypothetical protein
MVPRPQGDICLFLRHQNELAVIRALLPLAKLHNMTAEMFAPVASALSRWHISQTVPKK